MFVPMKELRTKKVTTTMFTKGVFFSEPRHDFMGQKECSHKIGPRTDPRRFIQ